MKLRTPLFAKAAILISLAASLGANAQSIKVGLALDLSGPFAGPGGETRDGFTLAVKQLGGRLGGVPVEYIQVDTAGNPDQAKQIVDRMIQRDRIDLFTGPMGSNVVLAVGPALFSAKVPYISNTGPSQYAGASCNPFFVSSAYQNDTYHEAAGKYAQDKGFKNVALVAPNYPAGRDALSGFKRLYKAPLRQEIFTKLGQLDYAVELAQIRNAKPDAVYFFLPGAMGINFVKQYVGAGLQSQAPLISTGFSADQDIIAAVGEPMLNLVNTSHWAHDLPFPANKKFVASFRDEFGRIPTQFAAQAYDIIMAMDAAVKSVNGKVSNREALLSALRSAKFDSVRGPFKYNVNNYPIQNFYVRTVVRDPGVGLTNKLQGTILENHADAYVSQCSMK